MPGKGSAGRACRSTWTARSGLQKPERTVHVAVRDEICCQDGCGFGEVKWIVWQLQGTRN